MSKLRHYAIAKFIKQFEDAQCLILVLELCKGKELWSELHEHVRFSESQVKQVLHSLFSAVQYLHQRDIIHRDLKLENIMVESDRIITEDELAVQLNNAKIIDFGLSRFVTRNKTRRMSSGVGTLYYVSPQILDEQNLYSKQCDVWRPQPRSQARTFGFNSKVRGRQ